MTSFNFKRKLALIAFLIFAMQTGSIAAAWAADDASIPDIFVNISANDGMYATDGFINMYKIDPTNVGNRYFPGTLAQTLPTVSGKPATFKIKAGEMVEFVSFKSLPDAKKIKNWIFPNSPLKHFGKESVSKGCLSATADNDINKMGVFTQSDNCIKTLGLVTYDTWNRTGPKKLKSPTNIKATVVDSTSAQLEWTPAKNADGSKDVCCHLIVYRNKSKPTAYTIAQTFSYATSTILLGLKPNTNYEFTLVSQEDFSGALKSKLSWKNSAKIRTPKKEPKPST